MAGALSGTQAVLGRVTHARPSVRRRVSGALSAILPSSGFGPAADRLEQWKWRMSLTARTAGGREVRVEVDADGHPGYLATARMLGEAGLLLAEPGRDTGEGGVLDARHRSRHGLRRALRPRAGSVLGQLLRGRRSGPAQTRTSPGARFGVAAGRRRLAGRAHRHRPDELGVVLRGGHGGARAPPLPGGLELRLTGDRLRPAQLRRPRLQRRSGRTHAPGGQHQPLERARTRASARSSSPPSSSIPSLWPPARSTARGNGCP